MSSSVYQHARYYEIAYGFVDGSRSVDLFEEFIREYSAIHVRTALDICCGPSFQLREFARRRYHAIGLDCSAEMLDYLRQKAADEQLTIETVQADMTRFHLDRQVDFAYIMMGSFIYVTDTPGLLSHLSSVAGALRPGGLYLIENLSIDWVSPELWKPVSWEMEEDGIKVRATYQKQLVDPLHQTIQQTIGLKVDDHGRHLEVSDEDDLKLILPQELKAIVELHGEFEFIGFFERDSTRSLQAVSPDNIVLLRKKG